MKTHHYLLIGGAAVALFFIGKHFYKPKAVIVPAKPAEPLSGGTVGKPVNPNSDISVSEHVNADGVNKAHLKGFVNASGDLGSFLHHKGDRTATVAKVKRDSTGHVRDENGNLATFKQNPPKRDSNGVIIRHNGRDSNGELQTF